MIPSILYRSLSRSWSFGVGASQSGTLWILAAGKAVWLPRHQLVYYAFIAVVWFFDHLLQFDGWDVPLSVSVLLDLCSLVPYVPVLIMEGSGLLAVVSMIAFTRWFMDLMNSKGIWTGVNFASEEDMMRKRERNRMK